MVVNVWDWRNSVRVATNKMSFNVSAISFAKDGSYFVAAGNRLDWTLVFSNNLINLLKASEVLVSGELQVQHQWNCTPAWQVSHPGRAKKQQLPRRGLWQRIHGNLAVVCPTSTSYSSVLCLKEKYVYVITRSGLLCQVNDQRLLEKWVELKVKR